MPTPGATRRRDSVLSEAQRYYDDQLARGVERFFGDSLSACPWCSSTALRRHVTTRDLRQDKPGRFRLDRCGGCGHVFQNPPVNDEGLDFYYRDAYDGLNAEVAETRLASLTEVYLSRAETVRRNRADQPRRWLDIGTAHAHFPGTAATVFPQTRFDGLDMSEGVVVGERDGRIATGYHGQLADFRDELKGSYDQVSMFHYLEHTRDPLAELDAVVELMSPDGWLLIEQPDPEARSARLFGSWWAGWNQPEHLHMVTQGNLVRALEERGLEVVTVVHREAHVPLEAFIVVATLLNLIAPREVRPWRPGRRPASRLKRLLAMALIAPLVPLSRLIDKVVLPRWLHSYHAYRVLARRPPSETAR